MRSSWNTTSRRTGSTLVVVLTLIALAAPAAAHQVPFTAVGTAVITGVTHLPGGLTQLDANVTGNASHLGSFAGTITRIQDHHGSFSNTAVFVGANGSDSVFLAVSGQFTSSGGGGGGGQCVLTSTGTFTVTGGTGSFANATGGGIISTVTNLCTGTATGTYTGTISQPNSN